MTLSRKSYPHQLNMHFLKSTEIKVIAAFFLVAGGYGLVHFLNFVFPLNDLLSILYIFPTFLYALTLYSGYLLLIKNDEKGLIYGRAVVAMQMVHFVIGGISYLFVTGAFLFAGFENFSFGFNFGLDNVFMINIDAPGNMFALKGNVLAIGVFLYLSKTLKKVEDHKLAQELDKKKRLEELD